MKWLSRIVQRLRRSEPDADSLAAFLAGREDLLEGPDPIRAFAPDPSRDGFVLGSGGDNEDLLDRLRKGPLSLRLVSDGSPIDVQSMEHAHLILLTVWDPYSAAVIGRAKPLIESGTQIYFVFFEEDRDAILESKRDRWWLPYASVLGEDSLDVRGLVAEVPVRATVEAGAVGAFETGLQCLDSARV